MPDADNMLLHHGTAQQLIRLVAAVRRAEPGLIIVNWGNTPGRGKVQYLDGAVALALDALQFLVREDYIAPLGVLVALADLRGRYFRAAVLPHALLAHTHAIRRDLVKTHAPFLDCRIEGHRDIHHPERNRHFPYCRGHEGHLAV